ncbi:MAG TPA: hypothetical protein P5110_09830 [Candidatus Omnitrophota bacterium]|nr:hypothetical protein [Candidatus Omnitrophota bacterium]
MGRTLAPKVRMEKEEGQYLRIKLLLSNIRLRQIAEKFGVSKVYVSQILECERHHEEIVKYLRDIPEPDGMKKVLKFAKNRSAA